MAITTHSSSSSTFGRVALWAVLVLCLVAGAMFFVVGAGSSGDTRLGGFMIALPAAIVAGLCVYGLSTQRSSR